MNIDIKAGTFFRKKSKKELLDEKKIKCKVVAESVISDILDECSKLSQKPEIAIVRASNDYASDKYVANKVKVCEKSGIIANVYKEEDGCSTNDLILLVERLNSCDCIDGIIVQLPLPKHINESKVLEAISPDKDLDCLTPRNVGLLHLGRPHISPCTPSGIINMFKVYFGKNWLKGKSVLVIGRSHIVGRPLAEMLTNKNATVTLAHSHSEYNVNKYDIVISAIGKPNAIKVRNKKAVLVDVGINISSEGKMTGDFDIDNSKFSYYTSVPGGVGLLTTAEVCRNALTLHKKRRGINDER